MRLRAYLSDMGDLIELHVEGLSYERAEVVRRLVSASRYKRGTSSSGYVYQYPLTVAKCQEMRQAWGTDLKVHTKLSAWYKTALQDHDAQVANSAALDADLPTLRAQYPAFHDWLKPDQRVTAAWMRDAYRDGGLLADEMGTGKTAGVLAGLVERKVQGPVLILCPRISVRSVWGKHFAEHLPDVPVYLARGTRVSREKVVAAFMADPTPFKVLVGVAEMMRVKAIRAKGRIQKFLGYEYPALYTLSWAGAIVDESHKMMGAMDVVKANLAGEGLRDLPIDKTGLRLAVTATPFGKGGRIQAIFGTMHWLYPDEFPSKWAWLGRFFEIEKSQVFVKGGQGAKQTVTRVGELIDEPGLWADLGPRVLRRRMEDVSPEHRGLKNYIEVPCEMEGLQLRQYKGFTDNAELPVEGGIISTVGVLDYMTRCRQFANGALRAEGGRVVYTGESAKIDRLMDHLEKLGTDRKVVIASQYNEFLDAVERRFAHDGYWTDHTSLKNMPSGGTGYVRLDGKTSEAKRDAYMSAFQGTNGPRIFLLNSQAGGVSITLDAADELHALDEMYPPEANEQLYGRIFRRGRVHEVFYYLYRSMGTIDTTISANVEAGRLDQGKLLDGRRGKEYARTIATYKEL